MYDNESLYWIWLAEKCGIASKEFSRLIDRFESPFEIYRLEIEEIEGIDFISARLKNALASKSLENPYSILKYCKQNGIDIITYGDRRYPSRLKSLEDPPAVLYCMGTLPDMDSLLCIGMVGTRKISAYGMQTSYKMAYELASANVCIVSGMALGVDGISACGALESRGRTVAVLGCGIDIVYPKSHKKLRKCICNSGAVISEYPPSEPPTGRNFPKRNRIISGLCQGVIVVEGNMSSGAMITAQKAISQGRDVFALPGKINESNSDGPNELIRQGANIALSSDNIILHYDFLYHDCIDYRGFKKSKDFSGFSKKSVERYGVSTETYTCVSNDSISENKENTHTSRENRFVNTVNTEEKRIDKEVNTNTYKEKEQPCESKECDKAEENFEEKLSGLDENSVKVYKLLPTGRAVAPDEFTVSGIDIQDAVTALTMLEISGLVSSVPGGMYKKK